MILHANRVDGTPWEGAAQSAGRRPPGRSPKSRRPGRLRDPAADRGSGRHQALGCAAPALAVAESEQRGRRPGHGQRHQGQRGWPVAQRRERVPGHAGAAPRRAPIRAARQGPGAGRRSGVVAWPGHRTRSRPPPRRAPAPWQASRFEPRAPLARCARGLPLPRWLAQVSVPFSPISGKVSAPTTMKVAEGMARARVSAGRRL